MTCSRRSRSFAARISAWNSSSETTVDAKIARRRQLHHSKVKVGIITLGCDKNTVDSERYLAQLSDYSAEYTSELAEAEIIIVNTCGLIDAANKEAIDAMPEPPGMKTNGGCQPGVTVSRVL